MNKEELLLTDGEIQLSLKKANDEAQLYTSATEDSEPEPIPEKQVAIDQLAKVLPLIEQARQEERKKIGEWLKTRLVEDISHAVHGFITVGELEELRTMGKIPDKCPICERKNANGMSHKSCLKREGSESLRAGKEVK